MKPLLILCALSLMAPLAGCVAVAAGTAGAILIDEGLIENDGEFDPFENTEVGQAIY